MSNSIQIDQFPYQHAGETLGFAIETYDLDTGEGGVTDGEQHISLPEESGWETGELSVRVAVDDETLEEVFPATKPNAGALVVLPDEPPSVRLGAREATAHGWIRDRDCRVDA